jgi:hypothetical protein
MSSTGSGHDESLAQAVVLIVGAVITQIIEINLNPPPEFNKSDLDNRHVCLR